MNNHNDNNDGDEVRALMNHIILDELCVVVSSMIYYYEFRK